MNLVLEDKNSFVNNFLTPVSKVTNSAVFNVEGNNVSTLIATSDNTIILNSTFELTSNKDKSVLNIPDISKLIRVLSVIEDKSVTLEINKNCISYSSENIRFKYHLFEDGIIITPKLNMNRLSTLEMDGSFTLGLASLQSLIKGSTIATDTNKIYLSYKDDTVLGELTDKSRPNVDSYGLKISDNYKGPQLSLPTPLNFEIFRIISSMRFKELSCSFSSKVGVYIFDTELDKTTMKFIVSALAN
jgi:hypothetical protein